MLSSRAQRETPISTKIVEPTTIVGVISDTHGLLRPEALDVLRGSHMILHAGDIGSSEVLDALAAIAPVIAVRGNVDGKWADAIPPTAVVSVGEVTLYMLHDLKQLDLKPEAAGFAAVISGHSHVPRQEIKNGVLHFNPGSAGPRRFALPISLGRLKITGKKIEAELITVA